MAALRTTLVIHGVARLVIACSCRHDAFFIGLRRRGVIAQGLLLVFARGSRGKS